MRYNVAQLLKEPIGSTRSYQLDQVFTDAERFADQVYGSLNLLRTHQGVLVNSDLQVSITLDCGRCLRAFPLPVTLSIEEEFFPVVDVNTGRRLATPDGVEGSPIDATHELDLTDVVRQCVITHTPMKPLCQVTCAGLCQECGANLNQQDCECSPGEVDPRWRDLASLLHRQRS